MTVSELIATLEGLPPDAVVLVEQTNYEGPEALTEAFLNGQFVVLAGDKFR